MQGIRITKVLKTLDAAARLPPHQCPPVERLIEQNLAQLKLLRTAGLRWRQIALGLPSWSQKDGTPLSEDQLRGAFSRVSRKQRRSGPEPEAPPTLEAAPQRELVKPAKLTPSFPDPEKSSLLAQLELTRKLRQS